MRRFVVAVQTPDEPGYHGWAVDLPGVVTQGETLDEFKSNMREAIGLFPECVGDGLFEMPEPDGMADIDIPGSTKTRLEISL